MLILSWIGFFILWWGCSRLISKMSSTPQTSNKVLAIGGGFLLSVVVLLIGIKTFERKSSDTSPPANQPSPEQVSISTQKLNLIVKFLVEKNGFIENVEYTAKFGESLNSRRLSFQSGNCKIVATTSFTSGKLELAEELETQTDNEQLNSCFTSNAEIAKRFFILATNFSKIESDQELMPLLLKSISLSKSNKDAQEIVSINGKQFALDHQSGKKITWMLTTEIPDVLK